MSSGQSRFALGSHVFSSGPYPFHDNKYSVLLFFTRLSKILSTWNSSSSISDIVFVKVFSLELFRSVETYKGREVTVNLSLCIFGGNIERIRVPECLSILW